MAPFSLGHASHPDWRIALSLAAAQIDAQQAQRSGAPPPTLGFIYLTDAYVDDAPDVLAALRSKWPGTAWAGAVGVGVAATGVEYFDEPALAVMLTTLPPAHFRVFSGARPHEGADPHTALVHADPSTIDLADMVGEMSRRTGAGYVFGGLAASRRGEAQALQIADGLYGGGLSGVGFTQEVAMVSRVTQGCQPVGPQRRVTAAQRNLVLELDGKPALGCLMHDLQADPADLRAALPKLRNTLAGLSDDPADVPSRGGAFGPEVRVRHLVGLDPGHAAVAIADVVQPGMLLAFCERNVQAARRDLVRICSEIREEFESESLALQAPVMQRGTDVEPAAPSRMAGALYFSCAGRGGPHFGAPSAELAIVQRALGDVPLAGFFAAGEIANRHVYGYTGVLTVFKA